MSWNQVNLTDSEATFVFDNFTRVYDGPDEKAEEGLAYFFAYAAQQKYRKMENAAGTVYLMMRSRGQVSRSDLRRAKLCLKNAIRVRKTEDVRESPYDRLWAEEYVRHMKNFIAIAQSNGFAVTPPVGALPELFGAEVFQI